MLKPDPTIDEYPGAVAPVFEDVFDHRFQLIFIHPRRQAFIAATCASALMRVASRRAAISSELLRRRIS